jgi:hypothetical protein
MEIIYFCKYSNNSSYDLILENSLTKFSNKIILYKKPNVERILLSFVNLKKIYNLNFKVTNSI